LLCLHGDSKSLFVNQDRCKVDMGRIWTLPALFCVASLLEI
jgi:hypothetical protein